MKKQLICGLSVLMAGVLLAGCTGKGNKQPESGNVTENTDTQTTQAESAGDANVKIKLKQVGVEVSLPDYMQNIHGYIYETETMVEEGLLVGSLNYTGNTPEKVEEFNKRFEESRGSDDPEAVAAFYEYMDEYNRKTIQTSLYTFIATKNGETMDDIPDMDFNGVAVKEYAKDYLDLGQNGAYHVYMFSTDYEKSKKISEDMGLEVAVPDKEFQDEFDRLSPKDINEFAKYVTIFDPEVVNPLGIGDVIEFEATDFEGNTVSSKELFAANKITFVNLWATWCSWCKDEMPEIEAYSKDWEKDGVGVLGACLDGADKNDEAKQILKDNGVSYTNVYMNNFKEVFPQVKSYPTTYIVDSEGRIVSEPIVGAAVATYKDAVSDALNNVK